MNYKSFLKSILYSLIIVLLVSCDQGFNAIGTDIIGDNNFAFEKYTSNVVAFNQNLGPVQSSNLTTNSLGIYENPAFGTTTANFNTQVVLASVNPTINSALNQEIESVVLSIPYFSTKKGLKEDGLTGIYELDSIYGPSDSKLKLSVYESGYFMRDLDPVTLEQQMYYTNQNSLFDSYKEQVLNTDADKSQNTEFFFSNAEHSETTTSSSGVETTTRTAPGMKLNLDKVFFQSKIFSSASIGQLENNNVFKNYFRGLFFKVEKSGTSSSNLAMINFGKGTITIKYKEDTSVTDKTRVEKSIVINLTGNCVNLFQNQYLPSYTNAIASPSTTNGDEKLYLKGGEGSMTVVNLFGPDDDGNGVADELELLRANKWLINDASLTFKIDNQNLSDEPNRIYLYDLNNKKPLTDYGLDISVRSNQKYSKYIHGGIIEKGTDGKGIQYKIKLTNHIRKLIQSDTVTNVKLGLVVTENINDVSNKKLLNPVFSGNIKEIPTSSVMNPLGTILFGSNPNVPEDKRLKLEIYYTKPN